MLHSARCPLARKNERMNAPLVVWSNERDKCCYREDEEGDDGWKEGECLFKQPVKSKPDFWIIEIYVILLLSQSFRPLRSCVSWLAWLGEWKPSRNRVSELNFFSAKTKMGFSYTSCKNRFRQNDSTGLMFSHTDNLNLGIRCRFILTWCVVETRRGGNNWRTSGRVELGGGLIVVSSKRIDGKKGYKWGPSEAPNSQVQIWASPCSLFFPLTISRQPLVNARLVIKSF